MILKLIFAALMAHAGYDLEPLRSNGALFTKGEDRMPLRCLEAQGLLSMPAAGQEALLDKAAAAGFNSVSFLAPAFGEDGFCKKLGVIDEGRVAAFKALLGRMDSRHLYAFPVLWNQAAVSAFARLGGGEEKFFTGKVQNQWQAWLMRELFKSGSESSPLSSTATVGGWILYRGAWPGPKKRGAELSDASGAQAFTAPLRGWLLWQLRALRRAGATQLAGAGFLLKGELGEKALPDDPALSKEAALPMAEMRQEETRLADAAAMDRLPPLPGAEKAGGQKGETEALTPWDLEGVDWDSVGRALREVPVATGLDFVEISLDTEDWYRVGDAMAAVAESEMQAPLLWRHDWRTASRYERQKRLDAPEGMAGLMGPWPDNDWPDAGETIWPLDHKPKALAKAITFKYLEVLSEEGRPVLALHLNRKGTVKLEWDRHWPPSRRSASLDPALVHKLVLKGAKFGENVLFYARAKSKGYGRAVLRSRWVKLTAPAKAAKAAKPKKP